MTPNTKKTPAGATNTNEGVNETSTGSNDTKPTARRTLVHLTVNQQELRRKETTVVRCLCGYTFHKKWAERPNFEDVRISKVTGKTHRDEWCKACLDMKALDFALSEEVVA
ncbi:TPA: hypothetical protein I8V98_002616 [Corynebacterium striatum]|nr:hypothetical protein [Corynebacterium striatum]HAT1392788.1 hypothetical protein [Corynebacterium striatum]